MSLYGWMNKVPSSFPDDKKSTAGKSPAERQVVFLTDPTLDILYPLWIYRYIYIYYVQCIRYTYIHIYIYNYVTFHIHWLQIQWENRNEKNTANIFRLGPTRYLCAATNGGSPSPPHGPWGSMLSHGLMTWMIWGYHHFRTYISHIICMHLGHII